MRTFFAIAVAASLLGCHEAPEAKKSSWAQVQEAIAASPVILDGDRVRALIPYESITLERGPCFGSCPVYKVTFNRDGSADLLTDYLLPDKSVHYSGHIYPREFARLAQLIHRAQAVSDRSRYFGKWTDDYFARITVKGKDGSWSVEDYGQVAPPEVWALEEILHSTRMSMEWEAPSK